MLEVLVNLSPFLLILSPVAVAGGYYLHRAWGRYAVVRLMARTATSRVVDLGSTPRPLVEVTGVIAKMGARTLESPITRKPCVYYELVVEERSGSGKRASWNRRLREVKRAGFGIFDGTGTVELDICRGELLFEVDARGRHGFRNGSSPELVRAMARRRQVVRTAWGPDQLRYREVVLEDGDRIYALGSYDGKRLRRSMGGVLILADSSERVAGERVKALARDDLVLGAILAAFSSAMFAGLLFLAFDKGR